MASGITYLDIAWNVRTGGDPLNGGGFCQCIPGIGAATGTDYSYQDAAQLSLTDVATVGVSATITSVAGGFTAAMVNNVVRFSAGTNFLIDYYVVKIYISTNSVTLDRVCTSGVGVSGVCRLGGAFLHPYKSLATSSVSGTNNPILATPLIGGHDVYIQAGTYSCQDDWFMPSGGNLDVNTGNIRFHSYGGTVEFDHNGLISFVGDGYWFDGLMGTPGTAGFFFKMTVGTVTNHWWYERPTISMSNVKFDTGGFQSTAPGIWRCGDGTSWGASLLCFEVDNSGGGAVDATSGALRCEHGGGLIFAGCVKRQRGLGLWATGSAWACHSVLFTGNLGDVAQDDETDGSGSVAAVMLNCTLPSNTGNTWVGGANAMNTMAMFNNIYSDIPSGKFAMSWTDTLKINTQKNRFPVINNNYFNVGGAGGTTFFNGGASPTWVINPPENTIGTDLNVDPGYTNAGAGDYRITNTLLLGTGLSQAPNLPFSLHLDFGAFRA